MEASSDSDQGRCLGEGEEWLDPGSVLKAEPTGFPDGLDVGHEKKGRGDVTFKAWPEQCKARTCAGRREVCAGAALSPSLPFHHGRHPGSLSRLFP